MIYKIDARAKMKKRKTHSYEFCIKGKIVNPPFSAKVCWRCNFIVWFSAGNKEEQDTEEVWVNRRQGVAPPELDHPTVLGTQKQDGMD